MTSARSTVWVVGALTLLAFALRLACLRQSLFGDELFLYVDVHGRSLGKVLSLVHDTEKTPPLGFVLGWLFARGGSADVLVRLPSFVAGVALVPLTYLLGTRTVGRAGAIVAAAWVALSAFEIFYGTEARAYAQVAALVVVSTLALLAALQERRLRWWIVYALAASAAIYSHYIAALSLFPQAAWALWAHRGRARELLIANALVVVAFLPWLPSFLVQARHSSDEGKRLSILSPLSLSNAGEVIGKALVGHPFVPLRNLPGRMPLAILGLVLVGALAGLAYRRLRRGGPLRLQLTSPLTLLVLMAVVPPLAIVLYSLQPRTSFLLARNLSTAVPYALLLFAWVLTRPPPRIAAALCAVALAVVAVGTVKGLDPDNRRSDARDAARYIDAHAAPGVPVVDEPFPFKGPPAQATRIYLRRPHPVYTPSGWQVAWRRAARARSPVFVSMANAPLLVAIYKPPPQYRSGYRVVEEHVSRGLRPILTREFAPR